MTRLNDRSVYFRLRMRPSNSGSSTPNGSYTCGNCFSDSCTIDRWAVHRIVEKCYRKRRLDFSRNWEMLWFDWSIDSLIILSYMYTFSSTPSKSFWKITCNDYRCKRTFFVMAWDLPLHGLIDMDAKEVHKYWFANPKFPKIGCLP